MTKIMAGIVESSPKTKRLSTVALTGAVLAVIWSIADAYLEPTAAVVSAITGLTMLFAGFVDFKHEDADSFEGEG